MPSIAFFFIYAISHKTRSWIKKWNATHAESLAQQHWACLHVKVHIIYLSSSNDVFLPFLPNQPTCVNVIAYVLAIFSSHIPSTHVHMGGEWGTFNQENLLCTTSFNSNKLLVSILPLWLLIYKLVQGETQNVFPKRIIEHYNLFHKSG